jgi:N-acetylglucosamine-6-phosphate deacetylase
VVGTPYLAGAARSLAEGVAGAVRLARITLADALRMATANSGRFVDGRGVIRVGAPADVVRFRWQPGDETLAVEAVLVAGVSP